MADDIDVKPKVFKFKKKGWKNPHNVVRGGGRSWINLRQIIAAADFGRLPAGVPTYSNIEASSSVYPSKKYCDITGQPAPYKDPRTRLRYSTAAVFRQIRSPAMTTELVDKYLSVRNAQPKLKKK
eukprot:TRINITY_DN10749_c0_g1_i2.p1 TRINITY_DN10749_c0_g1~~TRINITY_DN10749_c0_g1_i2.p1  ORF type:complete len:125 (-),score=34.62 TRINITY_DN10749_c0_g1_i2:265-639(-)